jgi:hypothetical protein
MSRLKQVGLFVILFGLYVLLTLRGPQIDNGEYQAVRRIQIAEQEAMNLLPRTDFGLLELGRFAGKLREVDTTGAPEHVQAAFKDYLSAVDRYETELRVTGVWNTNTVWKIGDRQKDFREALQNWDLPRFSLF